MWFPRLSGRGPIEAPSLRRAWQLATAGVFPRLSGRGPIEASSLPAGRGARPRRSFRAFPGAVPLKRPCRSEPHGTGRAEFPRLSGRGPIEASLAQSRSSLVRGLGGFRAFPGAVPLKRAVDPAARSVLVAGFAFPAPFPGAVPLKRRTPPSRGRRCPWLACFRAFPGAVPLKRKIQKTLPPSGAVLNRCPPRSTATAASFRAFPGAVPWKLLDGDVALRGSGRFRAFPGAVPLKQFPATFSCAHRADLFPRLSGRGPIEAR